MGIIFYIGFILIALAVIGAILKMAGKQLPLIHSISTQLILAAIGISFVWVNHDQSVPDEFSLLTNVYDSVKLPVSSKVFIDTITPRIDLLINRGNNIIDSIKAGDRATWEKKYFHFTDKVYDVIRPIEQFNKDGGIYQTKWFVLSRGRKLDGDSKYDSAFALNASKIEIEWLEKLKAGLQDSSRYK